MKHIISNFHKPSYKKINGYTNYLRKKYPITKNIRALIYKKSKGKCEYCKHPIMYKEMTLDHYIPFSESLDNSTNNLRATCHICNSAKKNLNPKNKNEWKSFMNTNDKRFILNQIYHLTNKFINNKIELPEFKNNLINIINESNIHTKHLHLSPKHYKLLKESNKKWMRVYQNNQLSVEGIKSL